MHVQWRRQWRVKDADDADDVGGGKSAHSEKMPTASEVFSTAGSEEYGGTVLLLVTPDQSVEVAVRCSWSTAQQDMLEPEPLKCPFAGTGHLVLSSSDSSSFASKRTATLSTYVTESVSVSVFG